jgi:hypothetical protein
MAAGLLLATVPASADDRPDFVDRLGRALQSDNDRDRSRDYRCDRPGYGSSDYDRSRDAGRGDDRRYDDRRYDDRRRYDDADRRSYDRDRDYRR